MSTFDKLSSREHSQDEATISFEDAAEIGFKIVEMADRVRVGHRVLPGSLAEWSFEMDDQRYGVVVTVALPAQNEGASA